MDASRGPSASNSFAVDATKSMAAEISTPSFGAANNLSRHVCTVQKTTGTAPPGLVGPSTTILGDKLYVFGGRRLLRGQQPLSSRLYELDLIQRHWTMLDMRGDIPSPRYFHSMCALGDSKLVCYGGMAPAPNATPDSPAKDKATQEPQIIVMSDLHILDLPTRTWTAVAASNAPPGRYAHCATLLPSSGIFTSAKAPASALQHNPGLSNQGSIGISIDGKGGAEMIIVGGQDANSHYLEQICVFNLRSLKWTQVSSLGRSCGAYRSVVAPLIGLDASKIGSVNATEPQRNVSAQNEVHADGTSTLIYSNYNFLDVKLDLQIRSPSGALEEKAMHGAETPPGLRFPTGGIIDNTFVISGTFMTSSKQEYALWALDLPTLHWTRIDVGSGIFTTGSWNRGLTWNRRNSFVILGDRRRHLAEDYHHRRINFHNLCVVELEAFGLYENPRRSAPTSDYLSCSSSILPSKFDAASGGRTLPFSAQQLGRLASDVLNVADMDILAIGGERVPVNSQMVSRRWGPYFAQLLRESTFGGDNASDGATLRPGIANHPSRNSSITITPQSNQSLEATGASTSGRNRLSVTPRPGSTSPTIFRDARRQTLDVYAIASSSSTNGTSSLEPASRPRVLYLPHTQLTIRCLVHYLYTSSLPPLGHPLCTPQILCSLLQVARPYRVDGLLEALVERLHQIPDGRNTPAVFNAAAMAAGGGDGVTFVGDFAARNVSSAASSRRQDSGVNFPANGIEKSGAQPSSSQRQPATAQRDIDIDTDDDSVGGSSANTSSTSISSLENSTGLLNSDNQRGPVWSGNVSAVVGLQLRGLRGLLEGRRLRERGKSEELTATGVSALTAGMDGLGLNVN